MVGVPVTLARWPHCFGVSHAVLTFDECMPYAGCALGVSCTGKACPVCAEWLQANYVCNDMERTDGQKGVCEGNSSGKCNFYTLDINNINNEWKGRP